MSEVAVVDEMKGCSQGHGWLVPINEQYCLSDPSGTVHAFVRWIDMGDGQFGEVVYAPLGFDLSQALPTDSGAVLGEKIDELLASGLLTPTDDLYNHLSGCYRVDDSRPGYDRTYLVWPEGEHDGDDRRTMQQGVIYHFSKTNAVQQGKPVSSVDGLVELMYHPSAIYTDDTTSGLSIVDLRKKQGVVVWDMTAIYSL